MQAVTCLEIRRKRWITTDPRQQLRAVRSHLHDALRSQLLPALAVVRSVEDRRAVWRGGLSLVVEVRAASAGEDSQFDTVIRHSVLLVVRLVRRG